MTKVEWIRIYRAKGPATKVPQEVAKELETRLRILTSGEGIRLVSVIPHHFGSITYQWFVILEVEEE